MSKSSRVTRKKILLRFANSSVYLYVWSISVKCMCQVIFSIYPSVCNVWNFCSVNCIVMSQSHFCVKIIEPRNISSTSEISITCWVTRDKLHLSLRLVTCPVTRVPDCSRHYNRIHHRSPDHRACTCFVPFDWPSPTPWSACLGQTCHQAWSRGRLTRWTRCCCRLSSRDCDKVAQSSTAVQILYLKLKKIRYRLRIDFK